MLFSLLPDVRVVIAIFNRSNIYGYYIPCNNELIVDLTQAEVIFRIQISRIMLLENSVLGKLNHLKYLTTGISLHMKLWLHFLKTIHRWLSGCRNKTRIK